MSIAASLLAIGTTFSLVSCDHDKVDQSRLDYPLVHELDSMVLDHYLVHHDFLQCFAEGDFLNMTEAASILASNHFIYSKNFIHYLETVANKIDSDAIRQPILENIDEENGNYEQSDLDSLLSIGIRPEWYDKIPHKYLSQRFFDSLGLSVNANVDGGEESPGATFTRYMIDLYDTVNVCEALGIIGFAIEETVSKLYQFIWDGLKTHTQLTHDQFVFFPLHILLDDGHADLLKLGFVHYLQQNDGKCDNSKQIIQDVLNRRIQMFDEVRNTIEQTQGYRCKRPYSPFNQQASEIVNSAPKESCEYCDAAVLDNAV